MSFPKFLVLPPRPFLLFSAIVLVVVRIMLIEATPIYDRAGDLTIYIEVGELVVNGVDPYDPDAKHELREALRLNDHGVLSLEKAVHDYYVSGNLPASTVLYGAIEWLSGGSARGWRYIFISGDLALLLAAYLFFSRNGIDLDRLPAQCALTLPIVWYPSLLFWGTAFPEDKQYQIALMVTLAALLTVPGRWPRPNAALIGAIGCLSILFKAFGIFLAPLAIRFLLRRPRRELIIATIAGIITALPLMLYFDLSFVTTILDRLRTGGAVITWHNLHGSPWSLPPYEWVLYARPTVCLALVGFTIAAYGQGAIDLLNFIAALCVVFVCLWLVGGSMDRMNIAMIFALICSATISVRTCLILAALNCIVQLPIYVFVIKRMQYAYGIDFQMPDAVATTIFLMFYFAMLSFLLWRRSGDSAAIRLICPPG
jgi:hypothetical protein